MSTLSPEVKGAMGELDEYIDRVQEIQDHLEPNTKNQDPEVKVRADVTLGQMLLQAEELKEDMTMHPMKVQENIKSISAGIRRNSDELEKSFTDVQ